MKPMGNDGWVEMYDVGEGKLDLMSDKRAVGLVVNVTGWSTVSVFRRRGLGISRYLFSPVSRLRVGISGNSTTSTASTMSVVRIVLGYLQRMLEVGQRWTGSRQREYLSRDITEYEQSTLYE